MTDHNTNEWEPVDYIHPSTFRYHGRDLDHFILADAARVMLETITDMTTEQFAKGADRDVRRALAKALGFDPDDFSL